MLPCSCRVRFPCVSRTSKIFVLVHYEYPRYLSCVVLIHLLLRRLIVPQPSYVAWDVVEELPPPTYTSKYGPEGPCNLVSQFNPVIWLAGGRTARLYSRTRDLRQPTRPHWPTRSTLQVLHDVRAFKATRVPSGQRGTRGKHTGFHCSHAPRGPSQKG